MNITYFSRLLQTTCLLGALLFLVTSCGTTGGHVAIHPSRSNNQIRHEVLNYTPVGSTYDQVQDFIHSRLETLGPPFYKNGPARRPHGAGYEGVGTHCIIVLVAETGIAREGTYVAWAFDENDRLVDVIINKDRDPE